MSLKIIRGINNLHWWRRNSVVTIGNFDGVHIGHQAMIDRLCQKAKTMGLPSVLVTFEPLPHEFFSGEKAPHRLLSFRQKVEYLLAQTELDVVLICRFDQAFSGMDADQFVQRVLIDGLGARYILLGDDFRFGRDRQGDYQLVCKQAASLAVEVEAMSSIQIDAERVSSTRVRAALSSGDLAAAESLLARPYCLSGKVIKGDQLGRKLGYPTANIHLKCKNLALSGVFAVSIKIIGETYQGMANIGWRPTVNGRELRFEVNIFDFDADIYGQRAAVMFHTKLRDEQRFSSLDALKSQLAIDQQAAEVFFQANASNG